MAAADNPLNVLNTIAGLNLAPIKRKLLEEQGWAEQQADRAIKRYRQFLFLCWKYTDNTPSIEVDTVWHTHILFTRQYADDCQRVLGRFLHHDPGDGSNVDAAKHADWFSRTCQRVVDEFGPDHSW